MAGRAPTASAERPSGRTGEPMTRRHAPTSAGTPGRIRVATLTAGKDLREFEGETAVGRLAGLLAEAETTVWVDLVAPSPAQVEAVGAALGIHPLIVEDVLEGNQRAKIEMTDGVIHLVLFALTHTKRFVASEIDLVLGLTYLLTVHDGTWDPRTTHHLRSGLGAVMAQGPDHLLWAIADDIVDGYFPFADAMGDAVDAVQDAILQKATPATLEELFLLKRELIEVRRAASPTREVFNQLTDRELPLIDAEEVIYFRDIYDHVIRLTDELDNYRELAASTLEVYLTQVNNGLSVIMKRLTGVTVILAGIGAVAGIFGMSEATVEAGNFWIVTGGIMVAAVGGLVFLRRIDWI
jgi:magnesium transporter